MEDIQYRLSLLFAFALTALTALVYPVTAQGGPCMVEGRVKLAGPDPAEGRVVICEGGVKVDVCSYTWNGNAAAVVCRELGLATQGAAVVPNAGVVTDVNRPTLAVDVTCSGSEDFLSDCITTVAEGESLLDCPLATAKCPPPPPPPDGGLGACTDEGRVEVFDQASFGEFPGGQVLSCRNGALREVCSYGTFGSAAAEVVCRELLLETEGSIFVDYGNVQDFPSPFKVLPVEAQCTGVENSVSECLQYFPVADSTSLGSCVYVGVECGSGSGLNDGGSPTDANLEACGNATKYIGLEEYWLPFLPMGSTPGVPTEHLPPEDDISSDPIPLQRGFPFGQFLHTIAFVSTNGLISFKDSFLDCCPTPFPISTNNLAIVAPYWADTDISAGKGSVVYEVHDASNSGSKEMLDQLSTFVGLRTGDFDFSGSWMLVAKWDRVQPYSQDDGPSSQLENSFQAILITNSTLKLSYGEALSSYAIFTYKCGELAWPTDSSSGSGIGYQDASLNDFQNHPLSGTKEALSIACQECPDSVWSNLVYKLTSADSVFVFPGECGSDEVGDLGVESDTLEAFGLCEPYFSDRVPFCDTIYTVNDTVYIPYFRGTQEEIGDSINAMNSTFGFLFSDAPDYCIELVQTIVCLYAFPRCDLDPTTDDVLLFSLCPEDCLLANEACPEVWNATATLLSSFIPETETFNCSVLSYPIMPLPQCCTDGGIPALIEEEENSSIDSKTTDTEMMPKLQSTPTPASESSVESTVVTSTAIAGGALLLIVLAVVVIAVAAFLCCKRRRRAGGKVVEGRGRTIEPDEEPVPRQRLQSFDSEQDFGDGDPGLPRARAKTNPYSVEMYQLQHVSEQEQATRQRMNSIYLDNIPQELLIPKDNIKLMDSIGQGEFGIVFRAQLLNSERWASKGNYSMTTVAVKTLKGFFSENSARQLIIGESVKMMSFNHPHILGLLGICVDAGPAPYIVMPFMANGSLLSYLRKNRDTLVVSTEETDTEKVVETEKKLMDMCIQIAKGMDYLASKKFIHRDLAARNCMIDASFVIKVADFGLSEDIYEKSYFRQDNAAVKLPLRWMALESINDMVFSEKSDVWSFGVTCWEVYSGGKTPFAGVDSMSLVDMLEEGRRMDKPRNAACSQEMYQVMLSCWKQDPDRRPEFSGIVRSISDQLEPLAGYLDMSVFPTSACDS